MKHLRRIKVMMYKTSLDGHWRGVSVVAMALRDAGMEVIYGGVLKPEAAINVAIQEDVDVIGLSVGGGYGVIEKLLELLSDKKINILIVAGGTIPAQDITMLESKGISKIFPPGSKLENIVSHIKDNFQSWSNMGA